MAFTQEQLAALDEAIASGTLRVRYGEKDLTYQSMDDLMKARALIARELAAAAHPSRPVPRYQLADFSD